MKIQLLKNEVILKKGDANHFKGIEAVGGVLYLTNKRVIFTSHSVNIQRHTDIFPIDEIVDIGTRKTWGIVNNGFFIKMKDGRIEKFVIRNRSKWLTEIQDRLNS